MSIAKGQDELAENFLQNTPTSVSNEFGRREVIEVLRDSGIQYFNKTKNFLGWLQSQSN
ncbi:hypothetical protein [aff. Roholtiella sp. LEGE 12411]|uniref:hypothetical protein n=1 Tax=aff. Roholtiella sp. LEGE 12411 TaxID=1828822 RepID=UPI0018811908|nr:hypothetical protein [aff. Roholtiella sp. LEGE 12411]MBE9038499.1 hypothetical protein [aff. Roholtiella sp. LEGE 12411]